MTVKSRSDYDLWKKQVFEIYSQYGNNLSEKFIEFISSRYDKHKRSYLPHKLLWRIFDLHYKVTTKNQHQVYGGFGQGGYGKTTMLKNVLYAHDPTFDQSRIASTTEEFQDVLYEVLKRKDGGHFKSILIDEPSKETHSGSKEWRITEDLLGQIRQNNLFIGACATKLDNIKPSLYSMITGLFAFRKHFIYDYYDDEKVEGAVGLMRKKYYQTKTYACFSDKEMLKKAYLMNFWSLKDTPIDYEQDIYDMQKKKVFMRKLKKLHDMRKIKEFGSKKRISKFKRNLDICEDYKTGNFTQKDLAMKYNITRRSIIDVIGKYNKM